VHGGSGCGAENGARLVAKRPASQSPRTAMRRR
jgi:hypothetical protein